MAFDHASAKGHYNEPISFTWPLTMHLPKSTTENTFVTGEKEFNQ